MKYLDLLKKNNNVYQCNLYKLELFLTSIYILTSTLKNRFLTHFLSTHLHAVLSHLTRWFFLIQLISVERTYIPLFNFRPQQIAVSSVEYKCPAIKSLSILFQIISPKIKLSKDFQWVAILYFNLFDLSIQCWNNIIFRILL